MRVIALKGDGNVGKSETINIVYQLLLYNGFEQVLGCFRECGNSAMRDFIDVLEKDNVRVGVVSHGDYAIGKDSLKRHLAALEYFNCNVAICACTIKRGTIAAVEAYSERVFIEKIKSPSKGLQRVENGNKAVEIYYNI
ncbi:MAG: hypothetical protein R2788_06220 [Saprospiraceae bacterium]